jgi:hypothetical protein
MPHEDTRGLRTFLEKTVYNAPFGLLVNLNDDVAVPDPRIIPISLSSLLWLRSAKEVVPVLFADTDPQAEAVLINLLRQASPERKLAMVGELNNTVRTLALAGLRQRFPAAGSAELQRRLADLLLGADLARKAYGPIALESADDH